MSAPAKQNTNTQIVPANHKIETIRSLLERSKQQIALALPKHLSADRLLRVAMTSIQKTPELLACDQRSLLGAVIQSAQLGIEPDGLLGHGYLVPFKNSAQLIIGYRGLMMLARRSGELLSLEADVVHAKDVWSFQKTDEGTKFSHIPSEDDDPGDLVRAYAVARLRDNPLPVVVVMPKRDIEKIRKRSPMGNSGAWITDTEEMWKKTIVRRICKMLPASVELQKAVALDEQAEVGLPQNLGDIVDAEISETKKDGKPTLQTLTEANSDEVSQ